MICSSGIIHHQTRTMKTNTEKTEKQFDLISSCHIVAVCSAAALLASSVVIQGQKEAINQTVINQKIGTGSSTDIRQLWKLRRPQIDEAKKQDICKKKFIPPTYYKTKNLIWLIEFSLITKTTGLCWSNQLTYQLFAVLGSFFLALAFSDAVISLQSL